MITTAITKHREKIRKKERKKERKSISKVVTWVVTDSCFAGVTLHATKLTTARLVFWISA